MGQALYGLLQKTSRHSQPWQVAGAMTLGCFLGLVPKFNLLFPLGLVLLSLLPLHFIVATSCIVVTSCLAPALQPSMGAIGGWFLNFETLRSVIYRLELVPLFAWLRLHNTIIVGWLGVSVICSPPVFFFLHRRMLRLRLLWMHQQVAPNLISNDAQAPDRAIEVFETNVSMFRAGKKESHDPPIPDNSLFISESMVANQQTIKLNEVESSTLTKAIHKPVPETWPTMNEQGISRIETESFHHSIGDTEVRRDEALRHLLSHLRTVKEKV